MSSISKRTLGFSFSATMAALFLAAAPGLARATPVYASGHCDLCSDYDSAAGALELHYHFHAIGPGYDEDGNTLVGEIEPSSLYTRVSDVTKTTAPGGSTYSFLGASAGSDVWILPQNPVTTLPYLGFGTEELEPEDWSTGITYTLLGVSGPGEFSMWMSGTFGNPIVYWATSNGIVDGDGNYTDVYTQAALGHSHANWGFTAEGVYEVQMQISGTLADGTTKVSSDVETFTFLVGSDTVVPEPGTIAMLSSGAVGVLLSLWQRRRNKIG
jgi:surface-anchored protein